MTLPEGCTPIFYLPGISRQDLRAVESCPDHLKPLAELQYQGAIWSQMNAKDWTILAFLKSDPGGLGLDVHQDNDAKHAMHLALSRLLDEEKIALLQGKRLDKDYFNTLLTGGNLVRDLLQWLDQGDIFQNEPRENEWRALVEICKSHLAFNPQSDGIVDGAARLAGRDGPWRAVWDRFCEPQRYPNIPNQIRRYQYPRSICLRLRRHPVGGHSGTRLRNATCVRTMALDVRPMTPGPHYWSWTNSMAIVGSGYGQNWGEAPLAHALEYLAVLAETTRHGLAGTVEELAAAYRHQGWRADDAVIRRFR